MERKSGGERIQYSPFVCIPNKNSLLKLREKGGASLSESISQCTLLAPYLVSVQEGL